MVYEEYCITDLMKLCTGCSKIKKKKSRSKSQKRAQLIESLPETQKALSPTWSVGATPIIPAFGGMKAGDPEVQDHLLRESKASLDYVRPR